MNIDKRFLEEIVGIFNFNISKLNINELGNSSNLVYEFSHACDEYILRISENSLEKLAFYEGEMDFINYLFNNGGKVSKVISSKNNNLVEVIKNDNKCYFVSVFSKAKGHIPNINNIDEWNRKLFYRWGQVMGKFHSLSKLYELKDISKRRKHWDEDIYFDDEYSLKEKSIECYNVWNDIINEIKFLSKNNNTYGLIHYDFHQYNFFINDGDITVFDFDDCLYHWYVCDIAIAFYHAVQAMKFNNEDERITFGFHFISNFLKGYLTENNIESYWIEKIPLFLEYRRICSYSFMMKLWEGKNIDEGKKKYLQNMKQNIENRVPYIEINFKGLV